MMAANCVNLKREYGDRYKVAYDESYYAQYGKRARTEDPVYMVLLCRYGHVYPGMGRSLIASVDEGHGGIEAKLRRAGFEEIRPGDFRFMPEQFDEVARAMRPRRRRRLSPEQRAACAERLKQYQPKPGEMLGQHVNAILGARMAADSPAGVIRP